MHQHLNSTNLHLLMNKLQDNLTFEEYQNVVNLLLNWIFQVSSHLKSINPHHNRVQENLTQLQQRVLSNHRKASLQHQSSGKFNHQPLLQTLSNFLY